MTKSIILIYPATNNELNKSSPIPPYSVLLIGSKLLSFGYNVIIYDENVFINNDVFIKKIRNDIESNNVLFIGISCTMSPQIYSIMKIMEVMDSISIPIVIGGAFASLIPEEILKKIPADVVVLGHGANTVVELCRYFEKSHEIKDIRGVVWRDGNQILSNGNFIFPQSLPYLRYELIDVKKYIHIEDELNTFSLLSSVGCLYGCKFCINSITNKWTGYDPSNICKMIKSLNVDYNIQYVRFIDDNPMQYPSRMIEVINLCEKNGMTDLKFYMDFPLKLINTPIFNLLHNKLKKIYVGIETPSRRLQKIIGKNLQENEIKRAVNILAERNIKVKYAFMIDLPTENAIDRQKLKNLVDWISDVHPESEFSIKKFMSIPNTPLYREYPHHQTPIWGEIMNASYDEL